MGYSIKPRGSKYEKKLLDTTTDAFKTVSKKAIEKAAKETGDLLENKIVEKILNVATKNTHEDLKQSTSIHTTRKGEKGY